MKTVILKKAQKEFDKLPAKIQEKIRHKILDLGKNYTSTQMIKLTEQPGYRVRIGDYRVLFLIESKEDKIVITRIKHRKDVYRNM